MVKVILNTDIEYDPAGHSSSSFHIRADVLKLLFLQTCLFIILLYLLILFIFIYV